MSDLLPCPFCGSPALRFPPAVKGARWTIFCKNNVHCPADVEVWQEAGETPEEMTARWNTRDGVKPPMADTPKIRDRTCNCRRVEGLHTPECPAYDDPRCALCGEPMPNGEEMFQYHGYSGPCPVKP